VGPWWPAQPSCVSRRRAGERGNDGDQPDAKTGLSRGQPANHLSVRIVRAVGANYAWSQGPFCLNVIPRWAFRPWAVTPCVCPCPTLGLSTLGCRTVRASAPHAGPLGCRAKMGCRWLFLFSKNGSNLAFELTCKFKIKLCRGPKNVKPILLGFQNHALPVSVSSSHNTKIFQGRSKYSNMLKYY
jgi:hypothetical protein